MTKRTGPTLTDKRGMGGVVAQDGFDYQKWDALVRLPTWLTNPAFEGFIVEGLEDYEARFFTPYAADGHLLDRFQGKDTTLTKGGVAGVLEGFKDFDDSYPVRARVFTLVASGFGSEVKWTAVNPDRIARARPFYAPFPDVLGASEAAVREQWVKEFGQSLGEFASSRVDVCVRTFPSRDAAEGSFAASLHSEFPELDLPQSKTKAAFGQLLQLMDERRGGMIARAEIIATLERAIGKPLYVDASLPVHLRSAKSGGNAHAIEIDAEAFTGESGYPPEASWQSGLIDPLNKVAGWARDQRINRVRLSGMFRLTTGFVVGWAFRSSGGFDIEVPTREGVWPTSAHAPLGGGAPWRLKDAKGLHDGRLVVIVSVLRDAVSGVQRTIAGADILEIHLPHAVADATALQALVGAAKLAVSDAVARMHPSGIDLFVLGPAALAVALGHRWNKLPPTQLYEFDAATQKYIPTALLE